MVTDLTEQRHYEEFEAHPGGLGRARNVTARSSSRSTRASASSRCSSTRPAGRSITGSSRRTRRSTIRPDCEDVVGKTMRELAPEHEEHWFRIYGQVAR